MAHPLHRPVLWAVHGPHVKYQAPAGIQTGAFFPVSISG